MKSTRCEDCVSFKKSHFCDFSNNSLEQLNKSKTHVPLKRGEYLFNEGDLPKGLYCVTKGLVKIVNTDTDGKEMTVRMENSGKILGYRALFSGSSYSSCAVAHEDSELCFIPKESLFELMKLEPKLAIKFLQQISNELHDTEERMTAMVSQPAAERIAKTLLVLKKTLPSSKWTRKDIADWAGTTPETVIRTLAKFEEEGLISQISRDIEILNQDKLFEIGNIH